MCRHPRLLNVVQDPAGEVEAEEPDEDVAEDRHSVPEVECIHLDQALERRHYGLRSGSRTCRGRRPLGLRRQRGGDQDPAGG